MSITTVLVLLGEDGRWAVETNGPESQRVKYPSRGAAISAGVLIAMQEDACLLIHGLDEHPIEFESMNIQSTSMN